MGTCNSSPTLLPPQPPSSKMKLLFILGLVALGQAVPQRFRQRQGRQEGGYLAPAADAYGAPAEDAPELYAAPEEPVADASLDSYAAEEELGGYDELDTAASDVGSGEEADPLKMLMNAVPGVPGEDYPIYSEAPETAFSCDGQIDGGYYADEEA